MEIGCRQGCQKCFFFLSMCGVELSLAFTSLGLVLLLAAVLSALFGCCYKYCYSDSRRL